MGELSHLDDQGAARMVDVSAKPETERVATAGCRVVLAPATLELLASGGYGQLLFAAGLVGALLTGLYTFRLLFIVFLGEPSQLVREHEGPALVVPVTRRGREEPWPERGSRPAARAPIAPMRSGSTLIAGPWPRRNCTAAFTS